jgi:hypothetical protein
MGWRVFGERLATADLSPNFRVFQPVVFNKRVILRACRTWFINYNDAAFTNITMKIYSNSPSDAPDVLIHSSTTTLTKAQIFTLANGVREVYFEFNNPVFTSTDTFHFVPVATGYTGTDSTHLAWKRGWPDPVYRTGISFTYPKLGTAPYDLYFIGSEL